MAQIASLPVLTVALGVGRSDWRDPTGQTLIDISAYVRTHRTTSGKMHELDRYETGTLTMELDNRLGAFTPFDTTPKTYPIVGGGTTSAYSPSDLSKPMTYVQITATWSGTTYNVFQGYISTWTLITPDEINSDVMIQAEDASKILSTSRIQNLTLYRSTVSDSLASFGNPWQLVRLGDARLTAAGGLSSSDGYIFPSDPSLLGSAKPKAAGAHVYDPSTAIDLTNGTQAATGSISWPDLNFANTASLEYYVEAWFKGPNTGDILLSNYRPNNNQITGIGVDSTGAIRLQRRTLTATSGTYTDATLIAPHAGPDVTDGKWHLVGLQLHGNVITMFCDGQVIGSYTDSTHRLRILSIGAWIVGSTDLPIGSYGTSATVADALILIGTSTVLGVNDQTGYVLERYRIGSLMQTSVYSVNANMTSATGSVVTFQAGGFVAGQTVTVSGFTPTGYNGTYLVTSATSSGFTVSSTQTGAATVNGIVTLTSPKTSGYLVLESLQAGGIVPSNTGNPYAPAPGLSSSLSTSINYSIDAGTTIIGTDTSSTINRTPAEVCLTSSDTELGAFFWSHSNKRFEFHDRFWAARNQEVGITATISDQTGAYARYLGDIEIVQDDLDLWTQVVVSDIVGGTWPLVSANVAKYGQRTITRSTYSDGQGTAKAIGYTILYRHQQPSIRVAKAELTSATGSTNMTTMLNVNLGDIVTFERRDTSSLVYSKPLVVESIAHDFTANPGEWRTTYVFSPFEIYGTPYLTLDVTTIDGTGHWSAPFGG